MGTLFVRRLLEESRVLLRLARGGCPGSAVSRAVSLSSIGGFDVAGIDLRNVLNVSTSSSRFFLRRLTDLVDDLVDVCVLSGLVLVPLWAPDLVSIQIAELEGGGGVEDLRITTFMVFDDFRVVGCRVCVGLWRNTDSLS